MTDKDAEAAGVRTFGPLPVPDSERDADGLTDRAYTDVFGLCLSTAIVSWLLFELSLAVSSEPVAVAVAMAWVATALYLVVWLEELGRRTILFLNTWRYGVDL